MTTYGLTPTGFVPKSLTVVRDDLDALVRQAVGTSLVLGNRTVLGIYNGILAERYAELWSALQAVYSSRDPDAATGISLDNLSKLTGTFRPEARYSVVTETLTGDPGTLVGAATQAATTSTNVKFKTVFTCTIVALTSWAGTTAYVVGNRVTNSGNAYQCITAGVSAGSGGPTTTAADITDGSAHWKFLGQGAGAVDTTMTSVDTGAIAAAAGDLNVITVTPVAGWLGAINLLDATLGRAVGSDQELRLLREAELSNDGQGTADAIRAALLDLTDVDSATVFVNDSDTTDGSGLPPHSIECLVLGGSDTDVASVIFANAAAGIATHGTSSTVVTDSQGVPHTIFFTRPTPVPIYIDITLTYDATKYPSDGNAEVQLAIAEFGDAFATGRDVTSSAMGAQAFTIPGLLDVTLVKIGTAPSPSSSATIVIDLRHLATFQTTNITVHSSPATP